MEIKKNMYPENVNFIANAGVKDIVGRGLIYNDNVAIIELVKNSKDAGSNKVILEFLNMEDNQLINATIVIKDFGCGMTKSDLLNKWLNIAYSEKKNKKDKVYAGNKGVGRFSCDRLGKDLSLYTKSINDDYFHLKINWTDFEQKGINDIISSIPLKLEKLDKTNFLKEIHEDSFDTGTVLIIRKLRSEWNEHKIKKMLADLEKFSPSLENDFSILFKSNTIFKDNYLNAVNNKNIKNNILEKLSFKTIYIASEIDEDGDFIKTKIYYQGEQAYYYKAINPYKKLKNIHIEIHYLDSISKSYFTRNVGIKPNNYGSIFLFYNSFRISPYGDEKNDWLGLDQRKSQGTSRYLGTRDIIGKISIKDDEDSFSVITSREGLAHNDAYFQLVASDIDDLVLLSNGKTEYGYVTVIARQLEHFVVKGLDWNRLIDKKGQQNIVFADDVIKNPDRFVLKRISDKTVKDELSKILKSNFDIVDFEINNDVISDLSRINEDKYYKFISDFINKTKEKSISDLSVKDKGIVKKIVVESQRKVDEANKQVEVHKELALKLESELKIEKQEQLYLLSTRRTLSPDADGLIHTVKINSIEINEGIDNLIEDINTGIISESDIIGKLSNLKLYALKSLKLTEIATRSGFDKDINIRYVDIVQYIKQYISIFSESSNDNISTTFENDQISFHRSLSVLNLSIVIDNIISNAKKWGASKIKFSFKLKNNNDLTILISDNGYGLSDLFALSPDKIFDLGARDEPPGGFEGSGIGLYYSRKLLNDMGADIHFAGNNVLLSGACFEVKFICK